jgi:hypothetical protein
MNLIFFFTNFFFSIANIAMDINKKQSENEKENNLNKKRRPIYKFLEQNKENFYSETFNKNTKKIPEKINEILIKNKINHEYGFFLIKENRVDFIFNFLSINPNKYSITFFYSNYENLSIQSYFLKQHLKRISKTPNPPILIIEKDFCKKNPLLQELIMRTKYFEETNSSFLLNNSNK